MIISILPGNGKEPPVEPGDEIRSFNRIRTDDLLKRSVKLMKTQHILPKTYSQSLKKLMMEGHRRAIIK
jgi:hypothetical protein